MKIKLTRKRLSEELQSETIDRFTVEAETKSSSVDERFEAENKKSKSTTKK